MNRRVRLVRSVFRWGVAEGLVPASVWEALRSVPGLRRGRSAARESQPVRPVEDSAIEAILPHLPPVVADMLRLQRLTGMRPGELCVLRGADIDISGDVWKYRPAEHKTEHHGRGRTVFLGPKCQSILKRYLDRDPNAPCFSPDEAEAGRNSVRSETRVTPRWPSHMKRNEHKRKQLRRRGPGSSYTTSSYARAISRACLKAFPLPEPLARRVGESEDDWKQRLGAEGMAKVRSWRQEHRFHPH